MYFEKYSVVEVNQMESLGLNMMKQPYSEIGNWYPSFRIQMFKIHPYVYFEQILTTSCNYLCKLKYTI